MFSIFKKQEQKYIEPSELIAYAKMKKVLESCETMQQLVFARRWMISLYSTHDWDYGVYYHHLRTIHDTKWHEICDKLIVKGE